MDTKPFFDLVLPDEGSRVVSVLDPRIEDMAKRMRHKFLTDNDAATRLVANLDRDPLHIFHACHGYGPREGGRKAANVVACRSFFLDIDVGPTKGYATDGLAVAALKAFWLAVKLPVPLVVSSGVGLHAYWPMDADMSPTTWRVVATMLKAACTRQGLKADPSRTADLASILRPVGSHHRKGVAIEVKAFNNVKQTPLAAFQASLENYLGVAAVAQGDPLGPVPAHLSRLGEVSNADLGERRPFAPSYADRIADRCGVMGLVRQTGGKVDQPTWYHALQILNKCEDGADYAHEWSKGDPRYKPAEVDAHLARLVGVGPTSCAKFADHQPALCGACPHKITSPISLGVEPSADAVMAPPSAASDGFGADSPAGPGAASSPLYGYAWMSWPANNPRKRLCRMGPFTVSETGADTDSDGVKGTQTWIPFCATRFYPVERLASDALGASLELEVVQRNGKLKRFTVPSSLIAKGGAELAGLLGSHEIMPTAGRAEDIKNYLSAWVDKLSMEREAVQSRSHFGWHGSSWCIGQTFMRAGMPDQPAILESIAANKGGALAPNGSLEAWVSIIDRAYNHPGQEAFQFILLNGFAAPLFAMFRQYGGITVHAHSEGTGVGKTTAQRAALSVWGNYQALQMSDGKVTTNALWGLMGAYANLPVMLDELTNQSNTAASEIVYAVSDGRAKERMTSSGEMRTNNANWSTLLMTSGNMLLSDKLSQHRGNAGAEFARLFEFTVDSVSHLTPNEAAVLFPKLLDNYGHAGRRFIRYVVDNYDDVLIKMGGIQQAMNTSAGVEQGERYWSALFAAVLTAQGICRKLGLVSFPMKPMQGWMLRQLGRNRTSRAENVSDPMMLFGEMLADLWPGILVTNGAGDLNAKRPATIEGMEPRGQLTGRAIIPYTGETAVLALSVASIKAWCGKKLVSHRAMLDTLVANSYAKPKAERFRLGRGTLKYATVTSDVHCWILNPVAIGVDLSQPVNIHQLALVGSKSNAA